ncbi:hypothetical protein B0O99DRAFT_108384 [Bisporella sp. PMI_857]|nr:hypothetical protein B0O99DRAFT_108384 [Bisporella sp. PMI_857]
MVSEASLLPTSLLLFRMLCSGCSCLYLLRYPFQINPFSIINGQLDPLLTAASRLHDVLAGEDSIDCPGVYGGFSARIALKTGFKMPYMAC